MVSLRKAEVQVVNQVEVNITAVAELVTIPIDIVACNVTMPISLTGSEIQMPIDLQGSFIALPVDIQAEMCVLRMDISAQTIEKIAIDIVAQTLGELAIKAGDIAGNVDITIASCQKVGLFLQPEWAAKQDTDKNLYKSGQLDAFGAGASINYQVPGDKTLRIQSGDCALVPLAAADADKQAHFWFTIWDYTDNIHYGNVGGNGGAHMDFPKPIVIPGGHTVYVQLISRADYTTLYYFNAFGYEE